MTLIPRYWEIRNERYPAKLSSFREVETLAANQKLLVQEKCVFFQYNATPPSPRWVFQNMASQWPLAFRWEFWWYIIEILMVISSFFTINSFISFFQLDKTFIEATWIFGIYDILIHFILLVDINRWLIRKIDTFDLW